MVITIVLLCSRDQFLTQVFHSLELLDLAGHRVNLLTIADGDVNLAVKVRNLTEQSKFDQRLSVHFKSNHKLKEYAVLERKLRISDIHNLAKGLIIDCDKVFLVEDDCLLPSNALKSLIEMYYDHPYAGFNSLAQIGRHGITCLGLWRADNIYDPKLIESVVPSDEVQPVDAAGFYAMLTPRDLYVNHFFKPFENNVLGCDVNYGISLRQQGYECFANTQIIVPHLTRTKTITSLNTILQRVTFTKRERGWKQNILR